MREGASAPSFLFVQFLPVFSDQFGFSIRVSAEPINSSFLSLTRSHLSGGSDCLGDRFGRVPANHTYRGLDFCSGLLTLSIKKYIYKLRAERDSPSRSVRFAFEMVTQTIGAIARIRRPPEPDRGQKPPERGQLQPLFHSSVYGTRIATISPNLGDMIRAANREYPAMPEPGQVQLLNDLGLELPETQDSLLNDIGLYIGPAQWPAPKVTILRDEPLRQPRWPGTLLGLKHWLCKAARDYKFSTLDYEGLLTYIPIVAALQVHEKTDGGQLAPWPTPNSAGELSCPMCGLLLSTADYWRHRCSEPGNVGPRSVSSPNGMAHTERAKPEGDTP